MKEDKNILLSILIATIPERRSNFLSRLLDILEPQIKDKPVELLILSDNMKRTIGSKRNTMIDISLGKYVCFIDDDDFVSENYVSSILSKIDENSDVIVFDGVITTNGNNKKLIKFGKEFKKHNTNDVYFRYPNHLMVHKKENIQERYKDVKFGEDADWAERQLKHIKTQSRIDDILYNYDYRTTTKKHR